MHFYPTERVALFIDGANLYATAKSLGFDIDYKRLLALFGSKGQLVRALYYTALAEDQEYSSIRPLIDWLDYNGYTMVTKPTKEFTDATGRRKIKGNMDIELAVDAMELSEHLDHIVLFSGDGDFRSLVEALQHKGKRVSVVSTLTTNPPMVADELRRQADQFIDLAYLQNEIGRDPAERAQREQRRRPEPARRVRFRGSDRDLMRRWLTPRRAPCLLPTRRERRHRSPRPIVRSVRASSPSARPTAPRIPTGSTARSLRSAATRAPLLIVGLAPGLKGANRTGRPFLGDYAGELLYRTLLKVGICPRASRSGHARGAHACRLHDHQCRALRAAGEQADAERDRPLPAVPRRRASPRCRSSASSSRLAASRMTARSTRSG